jgi:hypothetical protein
MAQISVDNGHSYTTPEAALEVVGIDVLAQYMDDDTRESVHNELAPCSEIDFIKQYLKLATDDLIIG